MATVRKINTRLSQFSDLITNFVYYSDTYHLTGWCDYVFDMYSIEASVKDSERSISIQIFHLAHAQLYWDKLHMGRSSGNVSACIEERKL